MTVEIEVVEDAARACAAMMVGAASGGGHVVLTGGSTPRAAYEEFVRAVRAVDLDLSETTMWFGDERCVPPDDERSNYRLAKESLLDPLGDAAPGTVHRMRGELGPDRGAEEYERELRDAGTPKFDLLLLGIGPDGHTASLFPDQPSLHERERLVIGVPEAGLEPFVPRISLTLPALAVARQIVFLVSGAAKAEAIAAAFGEGASPNPHVPSSMVAPMADAVTVLLDPAAAERL
jgi:6-phosphogluconolactonase